MLVRKIIFDGEVKVVESRYAVIPPRSYLVKPLHVYIGSITRHVIRGITPFNPPVVIGEAGVVRIIESSPGARSDYAGRIAVISPIGGRGVLSRDIDGLLSSYTYVFEDYIHSFTSRAKPYDALNPLIDLAYKLIDEAEDNIAIIGCDIVGIITSLLAESRGLSYDMYCRENAIVARRIGVKTAKNPSDLNPRYNSLIVSTPYQSVITSILENIRVYNILVNPYYFHGFIYLGTNREVRIKALDHTVLNRGVEVKGSNIVLDRIYRFVKIVRLRDFSFEKIINLIPPRGLGYIISLV